MDWWELLGLGSIIDFEKESDKMDREEIIRWLKVLDYALEHDAGIAVLFEEDEEIDAHELIVDTIEELGGYYE